MTSGAEFVISEAVDFVEENSIFVSLVALVLIYVGFEST
jgi:hypothetical protein